ncbi:hypothetical protein [Mycoplasma nasistruthionis]|uniref:Uncharacterized protein n=1 Tax=Mycoplasma nasistruthionis TaxID=353852 RepID=A0A4Y6I5I1_9MOLU|nr:hypothetical protein [Mycoplasma nasistruthionis]QDF64874.1 hypothetical protein FIV53_00910 [Mycoplasma nasistruthionis]
MNKRRIYFWNEPSVQSEAKYYRQYFQNDHFHLAKTDFKLQEFVYLLSRKDEFLNLNYTVLDNSFLIKSVPNLVTCSFLLIKKCIDKFNVPKFLWKDIVNKLKDLISSYYEQGLNQNKDDYDLLVYILDFFFQSSYDSVIKLNFTFAFLVVFFKLF